MSDYVQTALLPKPCYDRACRCCGGESDGELLIGISNQGGAKGKVRLCEACYHAVIEADKANKLAISYYRCGGLFFVESITIED